MTKHGHRRELSFRNSWRVLSLLALFLESSVHILSAQTTNQESPSQQIEQLTDAMARTQAELEQSQHQLNEMRHQLEALQRRMAQSGQITAAVPSISPSPGTPYSSAPQSTPSVTTNSIDR